MNLMLAKKYQNQPVIGWWVSEKLDGVRAYWDGHKLISRNGNTFAAPNWFLEQLPEGIALDGELLIGRGKFQSTVGIVRKKQPIDSEWQQIRYQVFDAPLRDGGFERRISAAEQQLQGNAIAQVIPQTQCQSKAHLESLYQDFLKLGAEGVMLRRPNSPYLQKRSDDLLKYKPLETAEATVIGHQDGEGRCQGMLGALLCEWGGKLFGIGTGFNDEDRLTPPAVGATVSFAFQGLTDGGLPRFPVFLTARNYE
jgi:DNA ligase 1